MRNQTWNQQGQVIEDLELYRDAGVANVKDWLTGSVRKATANEEASLKNTEVHQNRAAAQALAIQAIKDNSTAAPWGRILKDLAVGQGWIEP